MNEKDMCEFCNNFKEWEIHDCPNNPERFECGIPQLSPYEEAKLMGPVIPSDEDDNDNNDDDGKKLVLKGKAKIQNEVIEIKKEYNDDRINKKKKKEDASTLSKVPKELKRKNKYQIDDHKNKKSVYKRPECYIKKDSIQLKKAKKKKFKNEEDDNVDNADKYEHPPEWLSTKPTYQIDDKNASFGIKYL
eukprot:TRINITY_DN244_c1_g1_i1.p1 TRINITY_DN244_c1_g1~~TRINITY_DN244_c1_g1_i1.p1  ORF type:complete len:190 (-),score=76.30 TRINITY_DN244_c1_g1_i1:209-778(-)